jgi:predicted RNA-binding Zn ribbon-like protein
VRTPQIDRALVLDTGAAWLDLLATVGSRFAPAPTERLDAPARLAEWLEAEGMSPPQPPGAAELAAARELREALASLALASLDGSPPAADAVAVLERHLAADRPPPLLATGSGLVREAPPDVATALGWVARQAADHLAGPRAARLSACADPECRRLYLDPGGRRRWCSSGRCASRARVRAFRRRQAGT